MSNSNLPPLNWLRAFEASARHLSFTLAANELNLTQSAISQHVRSLETFLGQELFIRRTRALSLSEVGLNYLPAVCEAFDVLARSTQVITGGDRERTLIVRCNMAFSIFCLVPRLKRLYDSYPWLVLNIMNPIWDPDRQAEKAAVDIRFGRRAHMSNDAIQLPQDRFFPVCHPDYQQGNVDLESARLLDCAGVMGNWEAWFSTQNKPFSRVSEIHLGPSYTISLSLALQGAGIAMGHDTLVSDLIKSGQLIQPFDHTPDMPEAHYILPPSSHAQTPASRAFLGWLCEEFV